MHIKSMTISGFRSYRESNTIAGLSSGHNVIIGGNGCGKSNVLNAIQFVLSDEYNGLNANQRQQLLNESSTQRLLMAFVEIVVDNSDRRIPLDVNDITFRRQIGLKKDQYFMNNKIISHSDIVNMLETAGFSRSNPYYIIKQGKVTEMATASDECRLQVMREVAGTRIYDDRKSEAMTLLAEATQRVEQMDDCLHSLDDRLDSLQNESNDLQRFLKWDKRRRLLEYIIANKEAESYKHDMLRLEAKQDRENLVLDDKRKKLEDFQLKTKTCDKTLKVINGLLQEYRKDLSAISRNIDELNEQKARIESKINDFKEKLDFNRENESKANEELKEVKESIDTKKKRLVFVTAKYEELRKRENSLINDLKAKKSRKVEIYAKQKRKERFGTIEDRNRWIESELAVISKQIETNTKRIHDLKKEEYDIENERNQLGNEQKSFVSKEKNLFQSLQNERKQLCETTKYGKQLESKRREFCDLENDLKEKELKLNNEKQKLESKLQKLSGNSATVGRNSVQKVLQAFEERASTSPIAERELRPIIDGYLGQVVDCFTFEGNLSKVIEVTAKSKLFYHIVSDDRIGTKLMSEVNKRHLPGEFTFIAVNKLLVKAVRYPELENNARPLTSLLKFDKRYESVMRFLFDRTLVCRSLELATTFSRSAKLDCVTIDGDFISKSGLMSGGYFGVNTRIEAFLQWKSVVANIDAILQEMSECVRRRQRNETDLISNANSMSELDVKHNETKRKFDILKDSKERSHQQLMALNAKLESIGRSISSLESTLPSMKANKESFESELELSLDSQLSESEEKELSDILRDIEVMSAKHSELCQRRNKFGSEKASLESDLDKNLEQRKNELEMTLIDAKIMESETLVENESFDLELIDKRIASLRRQSDERDAKIDEMVRQENEQKELLEKLRLAEDKQMDIINTEAKTSRQIAIKLENIEKKYNECTRKLSKMGTIPTDCDTDYQNMSLSDEYRELQKCKHKLSRLTNVNQKALDQLNEGREKARLLLVEKREIDFAYESIQRLLETLEHQKYEKIQVTYKSVSKHFIEIFKVLVPEGKAFIDMVYKDTENSAAGSQNSQESQSSGGISSSAPGQTLTFNQIDNFVGVKIRVAFTGTTVVKELNQLSGGQKSIVALAFIFAIQRCDPPPFYLFDEVDSALDPTYRKALADLIDSMSKASQFITTTFRSELLGSAHKFFGVKFRNRISHIEEISAEMAHEFVESDEARDDRNQSRRRTGTRSVRFDTTADTSAMILDDQ